MVEGGSLSLPDIQLYGRQIAVPPEAAAPSKEKESQEDYKLIQDTAYTRDGRHRIPTPDKTAIMTLSRSFKKRRLGTQQQLLTNITMRCREQEVFDLSSGITRKVNLEKGPPQREGTVTSISPRLKQKVPESEAGTSIVGGIAPPSDSADLSVTESNSGLEHGNTMFPQRKVLRSPRKENPLSSSLPHLNISYRKGVTPSDSHYHKAVVLNQQQINGQIQLHHYTQQSRTDYLAPLVLPSIQCYGLDNNNVNTYIQARRLNISVAPKSGRAKLRITARR